MNKIPRNQWIRALTALPMSRIANIAEQIKDDYEIEHRSLPESGLGLLKMKDAALGEQYYLGEFPVSSAHVALIKKNSGQEEYCGGAHVMSEYRDYAIHLAICDAVLANSLKHSQEVEVLICEGMGIRTSEIRERKNMLASTKVDFNLLSVTEDKKEDEN